MTGSSFRTANKILPLSLVAAGLVLTAIVVYWSRVPQCEPQAAEATLSTYADRGIRGTSHPPSLSNLLWVHVGSRWHALPLAEKQSLDKVVRCAATTLDDRGRPTWQAAYYDNATGAIVALTSREYGFRLKEAE
ncbi:MAG: hypothetical protein OXI53_00645 [Nitrospira sp.]|nr:hypothetical protein [Nitrospira sp.]MDE0403809.1 hypothetical protein [Nitrospira sp.]MDE0487184.1 hypothetical protein [Nitrospira sp.]